MKLKDTRKPQRGVVLIVIVGILAILSLLAATFGMIARVELAASRNQTEYEMARQAAHAGAEYLLSALQSVGAMTSGPVPDFLPNTADADGQLLYRRDGVKVYMAVSSTVAPGSVTPDWLQGLGLYGNGMFNINAMGFANDLGSNCNPDIRYTSFDTSLVRLLTARFDPNSTDGCLPIMTSTDADNIDIAYGRAVGNPNGFKMSATERQRIAILLSQAIINWRHGPPPPPYTTPMPGIPGAEERRIGHLPRWNSKLNCTNVNAGVGYPAPPTGNKYDWGWNDGLPSLYINATNVIGPAPWSYAEPGVWTSYLGGVGVNWGNDIGLPVPGLFWGRMAANSSAAQVFADTSQPGWRDWPSNIWGGGSYGIYVATPTGPCEYAITSSTANTLTLGAAGLASTCTPAVGDAFCIFYQPTAYQPAAYPGGCVGLLNKRWSGADPNPEGDLVPDAMLWPNGALATEGNVLNLVLDSGVVSNAENLPGGITIMADTDALLLQGGTGQAKNWPMTLPLANPNNLPMVVHIYGGPGRGQVRTITGYYNGQPNILTLSSPWTAGNIPAPPSLWLTPPPFGTTTWALATGTLTNSNPSLYRIELLDNNLPSKFQPNNLQGNNRLYLSLGDLYNSVIVPALATDLGGNTANAQAVANILLPYFQPYLSVSTQAIQASQSLCSINDWAVDGVDNNADGVVDDVNEAQYEQSSPQGNAGRVALASALYNKLGLYTWAHAGTTAQTPTRVEQAAQLVANIIDFRDPTDVPTKLTTLNIGEQVLFPTPVTVYGAKGLHVTQVMPTPDDIFSTLPGGGYTGQRGGEMANDGGNATPENSFYPNAPFLNDMMAWDWRDPNDLGNLVPPTTYPQQNLVAYPPNPAWQLMTLNPDGSNPTASFTFSGLKPGFYALRLIGGPQDQVFAVSYTPPWPSGTAQTYYAAMTTPDPDTTYYAVAGTLTAPPSSPNWYTGFVRTGLNPPNGNVAHDGSGTLACFGVPSSGNLSFNLQALPPTGVSWSSPGATWPPNFIPNPPQFRGIALCAQYIQLTNISTHDINPTGFIVTTDQTTPATQSLPGVSVSPITLPANYTRARVVSGAVTLSSVNVNRIPGAVVGALGVSSTTGSPSTATFPINYGTYVICMCEEAYERQWTARGGAQLGMTADPDYNLFGPNFDGIWGDAQNEACTLYPFGDYPSVNGALCAGALSQNNATMALLLGVNKGSYFTPTDYQPAVMVNDLTGQAGNLLAGILITAPPTPTQGQTTFPTYAATGGVDGLIPQIQPDAGSSPPTHFLCYSSIEKNIILQPTWDATNTGYWLPCWNTAIDGAIPTCLVAYQNVLTTVPADPPRIPNSTFIRTYLNRNYNISADTSRSYSGNFVKLWNPTVAGSNLPAIPTPPSQPSTNPALTAPSSLVTRNFIFPIILNRPYPTTGWLGLVPTSNTDAINNYAGTVNPFSPTNPPGSWRTIDPNPAPTLTITATSPATPEQLLGTLMTNATVGGVYARFNINTAPVDILKAVFPDADAALIIAERQLRQQGQTPPFPPWWPLGAGWVAGTTPGAAPALSNQAWTNWDELLNDPIFQYSRNCAVSFAPWPLPGIGFYDEQPPPGDSGISNADAGAGTYADGFPDSSNEKKEWFMRFSNLFCLQSTAFQFTVAGLVYKDQPWDSTTMQNNEPVAIVRIEVDVDLSTGTPSIVHFRYLTQQ